MRRDRRRACWSSTMLAGYVGSGDGAGQLGADVHADHVLGRAGVRLDRLFGDVFRAFSPWRALGRAAAVAGPAPVPGAARPLAGRGRAVRLHLDRARVGLGRGPGACSSPRSLGYTVLTLAAQVVFGVETWTRYGEAFAVYFNLFARISMFETRDGVVGVRPPLGGPAAASTPAPGTVAFVDRDDRHRHLRRAHPGPAVEGHRGRADRRRRRRSGSRSPTRRRSSRRSGCCRRRCSSAGFYRARHRGRALGRRRHQRRAAASAASSTRWCRSRWSTSPRTT